MRGHIVAMGGGGFLAGDPLSPLDDLMLELAGVARPHVVFLPTATGDADRSVEAFESAWSPRACTTDVAFTFGVPDQPAAQVAAADVVVVAGGNTANMLAIWRAHRFDQILLEAWEAGVVLTGWSAGMICWFEAGVTDSFGPQLDGMRDGLGFLSGSACPHYDGEELRRPVYTKLVAEGFPPGVAADDGVGIHYAGTELAGVVSVREGARAYRVGPEGETPLEAAFQML